MPKKDPAAHEIIGQFHAKVSAPSLHKGDPNGKPRLTIPQAEIKIGNVEFNLNGLTILSRLDPAQQVLHVTCFRRKSMGGPKSGNTFLVEPGKKQCRAWLSNDLLFVNTGVKQHEVVVDVYQDASENFVLRVPIHVLEPVSPFKGKSVREK